VVRSVPNGAEWLDNLVINRKEKEMTENQFQAWADFVLDSRSAERDAEQFVEDCDARLAQQELSTARSATKWA